MGLPVLRTQCGQQTEINWTTAHNTHWDILCGYELNTEPTEGLSL